MQTRNLIAATLLAVTASLTVPAMANVSTGDLAQDVQSALSGSGNVNVVLRDGVATLTGDVGTVMDANHVRQAALAFDGVERVIDLTTHD